MFLKWKSCKLKFKIIDCFHLTILIYLFKWQKADEKSEEGEKKLTLEDLNSAHRVSQAKWKLVKTSYIYFHLQLQYKYDLFHIYNTSAATPPPHLRKLHDFSGKTPTFLSTTHKKTN